MSSFVGNAAGVVCLDNYNSDLNFVIEPDGVTGSSLHKNGFEYIWAGARATHGVSRGKVCFEVLVQEKLDVRMPETETYPHVMRVGWSVDASPFTVGEASFSYGYGGTGKSSCNNKFFNYGEPYSSDDVITCYIDLDAVPKTIFFAKNGKYLGVAFRLGAEVDGKVFYPHVSVKNMRFVANFGRFNPYFPPVQDFYLMQHLPPHMLILPPASPKDRRECEVVMMVGLPSCGKTTWLNEYVKEHPEKKYNVLGTNDILVKMKVMGLGRKRNYHGRWDALIKQASGILNEMLKLAKHKNRNYILDQTNVYPNARRRKMSNFQGYHRVAVVVVNENSILMSRNDKVVRDDGKVVPESAFMEMKANFTLPVQGDTFDEVWYVEENEKRSHLLVKEFNEEGRNWKEEQKKRPIDEVEVKKEPQTPDLKKPKYVGSANSYQSRNQFGAQNHGPGSHPQCMGRPPVPCQESQPADACRQENYHQQSNETGYPQRQLHYNPQLHERNQQNRGTNYNPSRSNYNDHQETSGLSHERFHQRQPGSYNHGYHQSNQGERGLERGDPGNVNYNQPTNFLTARGEEVPSRNKPEYHPVSQREMGFPRGNLGASYNHAVQPQGSWGDEGSHGKNYSRRDDNSSTRSTYSGSSQRYEVKQENWNSPQEAYHNPNERYFGRNQQRGYDFSQNYATSKSYNNPSQSYQGNSQDWNPPQQGGFSNNCQGFWSGEQGWNSTRGPNQLQGYGNSQQNVPQDTRQANWNNNQPYYQQGQHQNYQY